MSGAQWLSPEQDRIWRDYMRLDKLLPYRLNRQLQADSGLSLPEYAVLVELSEAHGERLRPFQLSDALQWEQSRLSHQLTRMQRRGFVTRESCSVDGRGAFIVLTEAGRAAIEAAAPGHVATVRELVFAQLSTEQAAAFGDAVAAMLKGLTE